MVGKRAISRTLLLAVLLFLGACASRGPESFGSSSLIEGQEGVKTTYAGKNVTVTRGTVDGGLLVPDGAGGLVHMPGLAVPEDEGYVNAKELRLKIRELGEQLVAGMRDCSLQGTVALPTSFVDLGDFDRGSPLGRLIAEQLYHEINQRGYPVREYRMPGSIKLRKKSGEFALSREIGKVATKSSSNAVIVGTYQYDKDAVFVNARLVRPQDGQVLRTASILLRSNDLTKRMARGSARDNAKLSKMAGGGMRIKDFDAAMRPPAPSAASSSPFDRGEDIH